MGFFKNSFNLFVPVKLIKAPIVQANSRVSFIKNEVKGLFGRAKALKEYNLEHENDYKDKEPKAALFESWGITDTDEIKVKKGLIVESVCFVIIASLPIIGLVSDIHSYIFWLTSLGITPLYVYAALTKIWRYECICAGQFMPFKRWLFG